MMRKRGKLLVGAGLAAGVVLASASVAAADDHDRGNHGPIWAVQMEGHGYESGREWGKAVSEWTKTDAHDDGSGVSEGVHLAKGNGPKHK